MRQFSKKDCCKQYHLGVEILESRALLSGATLLLSISLHLGRASSPAGDYVDFTSSRVVLWGQTQPRATVFLERPTPYGQLRVIAKVTVGAQGIFGFGVNCAMRVNPFVAVTSDIGDRA